MSDERNARLDFVVAAVLAAVAVIVFAPAIVGPFFWDDVPLISGNPLIHSLGNYRAWFVRDFWDVTPELQRFGQHLRYYRPLVTASYALDWRIGGGDPTYFHVTNTILHGAVSVASYFALRRWGASLLGAALAAALFALHPTKVESVGWIAGRTDVMCALFMLVASAGAARRFRGQRLGLVLEIVGTVLAYLSKEGAVVLPLLLVVERWAALDRPAIDRPVFRRTVAAALPQLGLALAYLAARAVWLPIRPASPRVPFADHAQFVLESIGRYVGLALGVHPISSQQALLRTLDNRAVHEVAWVVLGGAALIGLGAVAWALRRRAPAITVGVVLFGGLLFPVSNVVLNGLATLVADRFLYLPWLGIALIVAFAIDATPRRPVVYAAALLVALSMGRSFVRAIDFSDPRRFWERERGMHPESLEAYRFLVAAALREHRYHAAAALALDGRARAARFYRHTGDEAEFVESFVEIVALLTPDHRKDDLRSLDGVLQAFLEPVPSVAAHTATYDVQLTFDPAIARRAQLLRARVLVARADLASRLADDSTALRYIDDAHRACAGCVLPVTTGALLAARAGDYARARRMLDEHAALRGEQEVAERRRVIDSAAVAHLEAAAATGPVALNLRAQELSRLEAWGRAYDVLAPYRDEIERAPGFAFGFAELAFRAGEGDIARTVLRKLVPEEKVEPTIAGWAAKMGWLP